MVAHCLRSYLICILTLSFKWLKKYSSRNKHWQSQRKIVVAHFQAIFSNSEVLLQISAKQINNTARRDIILKYQHLKRKLRLSVVKIAFNVYWILIVKLLNRFTDLII